MAAIIAGAEDRAAVREELDKRHKEAEEREKIINENVDDKPKNSEMLKSKTQALVPNPILPYQEAVLTFYHGSFVQIGVAVLIFVNFFISAAHAQIGPANCTDTCDLVFKVFEWLFNILFGIELVINLYAHWFKPFWTSGWNIFDVFIVAVSWVSMLANNSSIAVLRLFRAFRAFRLFKRIENVRIIIVGVARSLPGVSYAFMLLLIIIGIWAIMGVSFFRHDFPLFFGNFALAVLTLFQVMTFDSWVSQITRPVCLYYNSWGAPLYFLTYTLIAGIIMTNVVVAILLDKFMAATQELEEAKLAGKDGEFGMDDEDKKEDEFDAKEESQKFWGKIGEHLSCRIKALETICREPMPETLLAQQQKEEEAVEEAKKAKRMRRAADAIAKEELLQKELKEKGYQTTGKVVEFLPNEMIKVEWPIAEDEVGQPCSEPLVSEVERGKLRISKKLPGQAFLKEAYDSPPPQLTVAGAIVLNFFVSAAKAQMVPEKDDPAMDVFFAFEVIFNVLFGIELIVNMYANGKPFWKDSWNIFDFFIVVISWASMLGLLQGGISVLRLFRAFRVFRLFKRVKALRQIISGIIKSLPGVLNAFVILFLVMGIWSIMGCNFFSDKFNDEFGNFSKAMLTMFQIMSYDSWSSGITRPVVTTYSDTPIPPIFFLTYVFISAIIMSNVVLAILLDKFLAASAEFNKAEDDKGFIPLDDVYEAFNPAMAVQQEHIRSEADDVLKRLDALDNFVMGPLKDLLETQRDQTLGLQGDNAVQRLSRKMPTGMVTLLSFLGIVGGRKKLSQVSPA